MAGGFYLSPKRETTFSFEEQNVPDLALLLLSGHFLYVFL